MYLLTNYHILFLPQRIGGCYDDEVWISKRVCQKYLKRRALQITPDA